MESLKEKLNSLPKKSGVYLFRGENEDILYIGKAKNLKKRVSDHFQKKAFPDPILVDKIIDVETIETKDEKEALVLEQQLIKKFLPQYNTQWRDDKSYPFIAITQEDFPRVFIAHQKPENAEMIGPFTSAKDLKKFLHEIRKIAPYRSCKTLPQKPCLYLDMQLCKGYCVAPKFKKQGQKIITLLKALLYAYQNSAMRIEGYDISNIGGQLANGSMVVFENGKPNKSEYKKFKIKTLENEGNDVASLREIITRRFQHDWKSPGLIILDGGKGQLQAAKKVDIPFLAMSKVGRNQNKSILYSSFAKQGAKLERLPEDFRKLFFAIRDEAHRFAIQYNKVRREIKLKQ